MLWVFSRRNFSWGFPGGSEVKASACNARDLGSIPGSGRFPWRRKWQSTPVFLPGELHGQRILADYSPWDCRESDSTEQLTDVQNGRTYSESESHAVVSNSLQPHGLYSPWNSPGQNTGVGSCSLLQGIFLTQELNRSLLLCRWILY